MVETIFPFLKVTLQTNSTTKIQKRENSKKTKFKREKKNLKKEKKIGIKGILTEKNKSYYFYLPEKMPVGVTYVHTCGPFLAGLTIVLTKYWERVS